MENDKLRRAALEKYAKDVKSGLYLADDYLPKENNPLERALNARNLAEDTLANEVLKTTGVNIPQKGATKQQIENFYQDLVKERYPELPEGEIQIKKLKDSYGTFDRGNGIIELDEDMVRKSPISSTSTLLHEVGHKYDKDILGKTSENPLNYKNIRESLKGNKFDVNSDSADIAETILKGHHASIPNLREGSFGLGALKSLLKSGTFKSVAPIGVAAALASDDASASDFIPGLDQAQNVGDPMEDSETMSLRNYGQSQARKDALRKMAGR